MLLLRSVIQGGRAAGMLAYRGAIANWSTELAGQQTAKGVFNVFFLKILHFYFFITLTTMPSTEIM